MKALISEVFSSIQGEGLWVGRPQVFVRFAGCKIGCRYCDTPTDVTLDLAADELSALVQSHIIPSLAITGGEPLEQVDFLLGWLPAIHTQYDILLETNGVEFEAIRKVLPFVDIVSMDIKLPSATGRGPYWDEHDQFLEAVGDHPLYAKVVFDEGMTEEERERLMGLMERYKRLPVVFQPIFTTDQNRLKKSMDVFDAFAKRFPGRVRFIPQVHRLVGVR
jgi:7-carboxy-7-deazaguanine synthase